MYACVWIYRGMCVCVHMRALSHVWLFRNSMDCSPPGSSVHGIFQARVLEWVAIPSSRGFSRLRDGTRASYVSCIAGGFFINCAIDTAM